MSLFFAFLHHVAALGLVGEVTGEVALLGGEITLNSARRLQRADAALGLSAGVLLLVGLARVFFFEKGAAYYFHNGPFIAKLTLFAMVGLASIFPTLVFLSWRKSTKEGRAPSPDPAQIRVLKRVVHAELAAVILILLFASLMAPGNGQLAY